METPQIIITVLVGLLGMAVSGLTLYPAMLRKLTEINATVASHGTDIRTLYRDAEADRKRAEECARCQQEQVALIRQVVEQNTTLINKIMVDAE